MTTGELFAVLRRNAALIVLVFLLTVAAAAATLAMRDPVYESTATVALLPSSTDPNALEVLGQSERIASFYATAIESSLVMSEAERRLGEPLGAITVRTFTTPVLKIDASSPDRSLAQRSAMAVVDALVAKTSSGELGLPGVRVTVIDPAGVPDSPTSPNRRLTFAVGGVAGLLLGGGAALVRENVRRTVDEPDDLSEVTDIPVLGEFARDRAVDRHLPTPGECVARNEYRNLAESARELRTNLRLDPERVECIAVTSPEGSHGKTTVAFALASVLARTGLHTVVVDADFGERRLSEELGVGDTPGLSEVLAGSRRVSDVLAGTDLTRLQVLAAGSHRSASELLDSNLHMVLSELRESFRVVVFDCPAVGMLDDARVLASQATRRLLVMRAGGATRGDIRNAVQSLSLVGAAPTGLVITQTRRRPLVD